MMKARRFKFLTSLLFAVFAIFQYNDIDPWLWIFIYGGISSLCSVSAFRKIPMSLLSLSILGILIYTVILVPEIISWINEGMPSITESMKAEDPYIEYAREFFGLVISLLVLLGLLKTNHKVNK